MRSEFDPLVKRLLDGELTLAELPAELRPEAEEALRLLAAVDRGPVRLSAAVEDRVMTAVRRRARSPLRAAWRWVAEPRELRIRLRPWVLGPALAAAAALVVLLGRPGTPEPRAVAAAPDSALVKFVLHAPGARAVAVAGTFNEWSASAAPLVRAGDGIWATTLTVPTGQHQYAFVIDGARWVVDPAAPSVEDGFGRKNSVLALSGRAGLAL